MKVQSIGVILGGGGPDPFPTFWSGRTDPHFISTPHQKFCFLPLPFFRPKLRHWYKVKDARASILVFVSLWKSCYFMRLDKSACIYVLPTFLRIRRNKYYTLSRIMRTCQPNLISSEETVRAKVREGSTGGRSETTGSSICEIASNR